VCVCVCVCVSVTLSNTQCNTCDKLLSPLELIKPRCTVCGTHDPETRVSVCLYLCACEAGRGGWRRVHDACAQEHLFLDLSVLQPNVTAFFNERFAFCVGV
jgi:hypothetical protein